MPKELKLHSKILWLVGVAVAMLPCCSANAQNFYCTDTIRSSAIQNCINAAAAAGGGNVILEEATYYITQTIIPKSNVLSLIHI